MGKFEVGDKNMNGYGFKCEDTVWFKASSVVFSLISSGRIDEMRAFEKAYHMDVGRNPTLGGIVQAVYKAKNGMVCGYRVRVPGSGLEKAVYLSGHDIQGEYTFMDMDGDSKYSSASCFSDNIWDNESKTLQDILNRVTSRIFTASDGSKIYFKSYEDLKGDKTKMGAYIPDNLLPKQIIYSNPATIVFWGDGSKTVVKVSDKENFNPYYGFCAALAKKVYGNNSLVNKIVGGGVYDTPKDKKKKKKKKPQKDIPGKDSGTIPKPKTANKTDGSMNPVNPFDIFSKEFDRIIARALDIRREDEDND